MGTEDCHRQRGGAYLAVAELWLEGPHLAATKPSIMPWQQERRLNEIKGARHSQRLQTFPLLAPFVKCAH